MEPGLWGTAYQGSGIYICGITHDRLIENNTIRETREVNDRLQKNAVVVEPHVSGVKMVNIKMSGQTGQAIIDNSKSPDNQIQVVTNR